MKKAPKKNPLNRLPARELTDREIAKILGGVIVGLTTMTTAETIRTAMKWWANNDAPWEPFKDLQSRQFWGGNNEVKRS